MNVSVRIFLLLFVFIFVYSIENIAVPAYPYPFTVNQNDGTELTVLLNGDEFFHYYTTLDGYLLIKDEKGIFTYGEMEGIKIQTTRVKAHDIEKRKETDRKILKKQSKTYDFSDLNALKRSLKSTNFFNGTLKQKSFPVKGSPKSLVILVEFADLDFVVPDPRSAFNRMLNERSYSENGGTGSARDYFRDNSMHAFDPEFIVIGPYKLSRNMAYYGKNNSWGDDQYAEEMVKDACILASNDINFSDYDIDGDGRVDNVFVFYAGYNEAEDGPSESIWPHRWTVPGNFMVQGKRIYDYACTSELRSNTGNEMCGIGTFVHEFGHVLGLPDYYTTNKAGHTTLSDWNVMDTGSYLNKGRTPPAYSAYDRFYLGWLDPVELSNTTEGFIEPLVSSNLAYLITESGNHNMNGSNPAPAEFFTLENRQNIGWDTFLPGHGLLITRINYDASTWSANTVNNNPNKMGVEIIKPAGSLSTFPGKTEVGSYTPVLRSGKELDKHLIHIKEQDKIVLFKFLGPVSFVPPRFLNVNNITANGFTANWENDFSVDSYSFSLFTLTEGVSSQTEGFNTGLNLIDWKYRGIDTIIQSGYYAATAPAVLFNQEQGFLETEEYPLPAGELSFSIKLWESNSEEMLLEAWNRIQWQIIDTIKINTDNQGEKKYTFDSEDKFVRFRFTYSKKNKGVAIDDITIYFKKRLDYVTKNEQINSTTYNAVNLLPDLDYYYNVRSLRNTGEKELVSELSESMKVRTAKETNNKNLKVLYANNGNVLLYILNEDFGKTAYIYNISGQLIKTFTLPYLNFIDIEGLSLQQIYFIKIDKRISKLLML